MNQPIVHNLIEIDQEEDRQLLQRQVAAAAEQQAQEDEESRPCLSADLLQHCKNLLDAVDSFPEEEQAAYQECFDTAPGLLETEADLTRFLEQEDFHVFAAASRVLAYFSRRKAIFGARFLKTMNMTGHGALSVKELAELQTGFLSVLPEAAYKDVLSVGGTKRPIIFEDASPVDSEERERSRERCRFYMLTIMASRSSSGVLWIRFGSDDTSHLQSLVRDMAIHVKVEQQSLRSSHVSLSQKLANEGFTVHGMSGDGGHFERWMQQQLYFEQRNHYQHQTKRAAERRRSTLARRQRKRQVKRGASDLLQDQSVLLECERKLYHHLMRRKNELLVELDATQLQLNNQIAQPVVNAHLPNELAQEMVARLNQEQNELLPDPVKSSSVLQHVPFCLVRKQGELRDLANALALFQSI